MPIDRANRDRAAAALAAYLRGEIDNFKLDDETLGLRTQDRALIDVSSDVWHFYDDVKRHTVRCAPEAWDFLTRCVAFLRTDIETGTKLCEATIEFAPFASPDAWNDHRGCVAADNLPAYDPTRHGRRPRPPGRASGSAAAVVAILLLCASLIRGCG